MVQNIENKTDIKQKRETISDFSFVSVIFYFELRPFRFKKKRNAFILN